MKFGKYKKFYIEEIIYMDRPYLEWLVKTKWVDKKTRAYIQSSLKIKIESIGEELTAQFLNKYNIKYEREKTFSLCIDKTLLPFDFYLPDYHICIELNGSQHYKMVGDMTEKDLKSQQHRDRIKKKYCRDHNIKLLIIPYTDYDNIEAILTTELGL